MDPGACLQRAASALADGDLDEAAAALADYGDWRRRGGYEPPAGDEGARLLGRLVERLRRAAGGGGDERRHDGEGF
jgi:hypothetical protein